MNEQLKRISEKIRTTKPTDNKKWIELTFNYGKYVGEEFDTLAIEWVASYKVGFNRDYIDFQYNYFGETPKEALDRLEENLFKDIY